MYTMSSLDSLFKIVILAFNILSMFFTNPTHVFSRDPIDLNGVLRYASMPVRDANGDFVTHSIFMNEPDVIYHVRSFHLVADDRDYRHFVKDRKRLVKTFWKAFEGYKYIE
eukprot:878709_1